MIINVKIKGVPKQVLILIKAVQTYLGTPMLFREKSTQTKIDILKDKLEREEGRLQYSKMNYNY